jgi:hypothetical protein
MVKKSVPHFIAGRLDPQARIVEYATIEVDCPPQRERAVVLFTSREKAQRFIDGSDRGDFVPVHLDYEHLRDWIESSVLDVAPLAVVDVAGGTLPHPALAFELASILEAICATTAESDVVSADSFAVFV